MRRGLDNRVESVTFDGGVSATFWRVKLCYDGEWLSRLRAHKATLYRPRGAGSPLLSLSLPRGVPPRAHARSALNPFIIAFLISGLVVLAVLLSSAPKRSRPAAPLSPEARLELCVRSLSDLDAHHLAQRRLLSMGAGAVHPLLRCLEHIDLHPLAYSAHQQAEVEAILSNLGPQTLTPCARFYQRAHRSAPTFPALLRVLAAHADAALLCVANTPPQHPTPLPVAALSFLASRLPARALLSALRQHDPLWTADGVHRVAVSLLPLLGRADASFQRTLADDAPNLWQRLQDLERQWLPLPCAPPSLAVATPSRAADAALTADVALTADAALAALDRAPSACADAHLIDDLAPFIDDPRAQERLIRLIHHGSPLGPHALAHLAAHRVRGLQPLLNTLLRQPLDAAQRLCLKRAVASYPEPCTQTLSLLLLSEQPLYALQAAEVLSSRAADDPATARLLLKAAHRHRHTPLEAHLLASLFIRPWPCLLPTLRAGARDADTDVQAACLELLGLYGDAEDAASITDWLLSVQLPHRATRDAALNALELLACSLPSPLRLPPIPADHPARPHILRRLDLVAALAASRARHP
jgi:hypothetical protein